MRANRRSIFLLPELTSGFMVRAGVLIEIPEVFTGCPGCREDGWRTGAMSFRLVSTVKLRYARFSARTSRLGIALKSFDEVLGKSSRSHRRRAADGMIITCLSFGVNFTLHSTI